MQNNMTCFRVGSEYGDNVYECCESVVPSMLTVMAVGGAHAWCQDR